MPRKISGGAAVNGIRRRVRFLLLAAFLMPLSLKAQVLFEFNLPAQALDQSLWAVASRAHVTVAFDPANMAGKRASALTGSYSAREALETLLRGSGLRVRETRGGSFWIEAVSSAHGAAASR
ncbi:STN domain-containing protein [Pelomonas sp. KK5]|uniref:STN domain-containing protein n=1 Tax=Pelomonas sp. KK5 TaxID=1855730 RepID=UPI00117C6FD5|nr:STN domain-containing protein [Pelomonas sp. KK5]